MKMQRVTESTNPSKHWTKQYSFQNWTI